MISRAAVDAVGVVVLHDRAVSQRDKRRRHGRKPVPPADFRISS
jgi:hypothetical protein